MIPRAVIRQQSKKGISPSELFLQDCLLANGSLSAPNSHITFFPPFPLSLTCFLLANSGTTEDKKSRVFPIPIDLPKRSVHVGGSTLTREPHDTALSSVFVICAYMLINMEHMKKETAVLSVVADGILVAVSGGSWPL